MLRLVPGGPSRLLPGACPLFHEDGKATGVFVDSESKVVDRLKYVVSSNCIYVFQVLHRSV
jgi:hypothetical protein